MIQEYPVVKHRLDQQLPGPDRPPRADDRRDSRALHPAFGLLVAVAISAFPWVVFLWLFLLLSSR